MFPDTLYPSSQNALVASECMHVLSQLNYFTTSIHYDSRNKIVCSRNSLLYTWLKKSTNVLSHPTSARFLMTEGIRFCISSIPLSEKSDGSKATSWNNVLCVD